MFFTQSPLHIRGPTCDSDCCGHSGSFLHMRPGQHLASGILKGLIKPLPPPHPADSGPQDIAASFEALFLNDPPPDPGFQGESSVAMLVKTAVAIKSGRLSIRDRKTPAPDPWNLKPWDTQRCTETQHLTFPQEHLLSSLISLYFVNVNIFIPVLHRPSFEDGLARRIHLRQDDFASTLLLVCELGSLYLPEHGVSDGDRSKLAWSWYDQVELCGHSLRRQPTTYDLQAYCLAAHFLACASNPRASWSIVGFGLRLAQDIGALRRNVIAPTISTEEELEKRATWILMLLDAHLATALGRMTTLNPFDLDISVPSEYDDEWWNSEPEYKPQHPPSTIVFFNCIIGLYQILHFMLKNLYSTSRLYTANGSQDLQMLAAELDVTLNKWFSAIPQHLIWDPERLLDGIFFDQSAALHCFYDYIRMLLHRPFILGMSRTSQPNPRAQRICIKAACACISVANTHRLRHPDVPLFLSQNPLFTAAMVLILDMWAHPQHADERAQNIASVHIALEIFRSQQKRWPSSDFFVNLTSCRTLRLVAAHLCPGSTLSRGLSLRKPGWRARCSIEIPPLLRSRCLPCLRLTKKWRRRSITGCGHSQSCSLIVVDTIWENLPSLGLATGNQRANNHGLIVIDFISKF
ncbi:fungal-specific transcription factor domain-containing protein [Mycena olivaceomarginata]|nr:fungal-specific transcription factor domain-containing protein [Mycena olivaceomarginata]